MSIDSSFTLLARQAPQHESSSIQNHGTSLLKSLSTPENSLGKDESFERHESSMVNSVLKDAEHTILVKRTISSTDCTAEPSSNQLKRQCTDSTHATPAMRFSD